MSASPRNLAFRDRFVWELVQTVLARWDDFDDFADRYVFPDLTTQVPFVLYLSQVDFTTLYSAVLTGADLTYPNTSHDVELLFLQMVGMPMNQLCTAIANCIDNSSDVQIAINNYLQDNGFGFGAENPLQPLSPGVTGNNLLPDGYSCTNDLAFGMSLAVVNAINEATTEVLQAIEVATNSLELAAEMADNIPGASVLTAGLDVASWIQDTAAENYDLAWSTVIRDELACLVWCSMLNGCELSFDTLWDIYLEESGIAPPTETDLISWLEWLISIVFTTDRQTVATVSLLGLLMMRYGGKFGSFALGIRSLEMVILLSEDESDSDWDILCDTCPPDWCSVTDFTIDDGGFVRASKGNAAGSWVDGTGWVHEDVIFSNNHRNRAVIIDRYWTEAPIRKVSVTFDFSEGAPFLEDDMAGIQYILEKEGTPTFIVIILSQDLPDGEDITITWEDTAEDADYIKLFFRSSWDNSAPYTFGGNITLTSFEICGEGEKPVELP